jgi:hypothetical protein
MKKLKVRKIKKFLPKKIQTRRAGYLGLALLIIFSLFTYDIFFRSPKVKAATIVGNSDSSSGISSVRDRSVLITSTGTIVVIYYTTTETPSGLVYRTSSNSGATWSSATQISSNTPPVSFFTTPYSFSAAIDSNNNIYIVSDLDPSLVSYKLTYSAGSWTVGAQNTIVTGDSHPIDCGFSGSTKYTFYGGTSITIDSTNKLWLTYSQTNQTGCVVTATATITASSTNGSTWSNNTASLNCGSGPMVKVGSGIWMACTTGIYKDLTSSGSWTQANAITFPNTAISLVSRTSDELDMVYTNASNQPAFRTYTISTSTLSAETVLSANVNDQLGQLAVSGTTLQYFYGSYLASNSYNILFKIFDGSSWDSGHSLALDGLNNQSISVPINKGSLTWVPVVWVAGTASPYIIKEQAAVVNYSPSSPTLINPTLNGTSVSVYPVFQLRTTDADNDYLRYKIQLCQDAACSTVLQTFDETSSQTGWSGQDQQGGTAYTGSSTLTSSTIANYTAQSPLSQATVYYWRGYAIDPAGNVMWSSPSPVQQFTTVSNSSPSAPSLVAPGNGATGVGLRPTLQLRSSDADNDYLQYNIQLCQDAGCSVLLQTFYETSSQTGWSGQDQQGGTAYTGSSTLTSSTIANYTLQSSLSPSTTYYWRAYAIDPGGTNSFGSASAMQSFTTGADSTPAPPVLVSPNSGATGTSTSPLLQVHSSDADGDYLRYKIIVYNSDCATNPQTFDETSSQTGWSGQDQQGGTAYTGSSIIGDSTIATYGSANLSAGTQYCWKAAAIDPGGSNTWSAFSSTQLFTTGSASGQVQLNGNTQIRGGTLIR